jgi:hypothetical protein
VALEFLAGERQVRDAELRDSEGKLASFMAQHPRFALDATPLANGAAIRASIGGTVSSPVASRFAWPPRPRAGSGSAEAKSPTPGALTGGGSGGGNNDEARARADLAAARENLTDKLIHYTPAHPDVRAAEAAVQRATQRLAAVTGSGPQTPPPEAATGQASAANAAAPPTPRGASAVPRPVAVDSAPVSSGQRTQNLVDLETQWLTLTRAVTEARQRLDQIEEQLFRADILVSSESGGHGVQVNVIDPAFLPQRPLPPGKTMIALIFLAASLVVGGLSALVFAAFDEQVLGARDAFGIAEILVEVPRGSV